MPNINIGIIGECMVEISSHPDGKVQQRFGGDTLNTAIYLKKMTDASVNAHYITSMGNDHLSESLITQWQEHQVNADSVLINKDKTVGLYMIENDASGERFFHYWRNDSAARYLVRHPDFGHVLSNLSHFDAIYLSGISLAILPVDDCAYLLTHLTMLAERGVKIIFDSNYRPKLWATPQHCRDTMERAYRLADLALITFDDEQALWQDKTLEQCQQRLEQYNIKELILKDGANGCRYIHQGQSSHFPTQKVANVIDTTAAGDSFNGGFLAYWLRGYPIATCAEAGNQLAGQVIGQVGAIVEIDRTRIERALT